ncbi:MAG: hypothetical protein Q4E74_03765 [Ruminococcus sp.]|nr:hypothetical protein [Ruminococcus sp.]
MGKEKRRKVTYEKIIAIFILSIAVLFVGGFALYLIGVNSLFEQMSEIEYGEYMTFRNSDETHTLYIREWSSFRNFGFEACLDDVNSQTYCEYTNEFSPFNKPEDHEIVWETDKVTVKYKFSVSAEEFTTLEIPFDE